MPKVALTSRRLSEIAYRPPVKDPIRIRGARQNNLRGIDLDIPVGELVVITGPSGSGKSSLAFDTIYAEGQRRYIETFSPYTRQFFERMDKPQVEEISGIPPAIALEQNNSVRNSRSTVGTLTEINDHLKLLFPLLAEASCPLCRREIRPETAHSILHHLIESLSGKTLLLAFLIPAPKKVSPAELFSLLQNQGYLRVWIAGQLLRTDEPPVSTLKLPSEIVVVQDRLGPLDPEHASRTVKNRLAESIETALHLGGGKLLVIETDTGKEHPFSRGWHCAHCDLSIRPPTPSLFSFNHPLGACPKCRGFGRLLALDLDKAIPDRSLSLEQGAVRAFSGTQFQESQRDLIHAARQAQIPTRVPFDKLSETDQRWVIKGDPDASTMSPEQLWESGLWYGVEGFFKWLESKAYKMHVRVFLSRYRSACPCPTCNAGRYQPETLNYRLRLGSNALTLPEINALPTDDLLPRLESLQSKIKDCPQATLVLNQIISRLRCLEDVGLGYLTLDRTARTLSGGELQRVNLTSCIGAGLVNTLFVLDEPTIGLHPEDTDRLVQALRSLRDRGNTLVVVEHEEAVMRAANRIVDIGPGRGQTGGKLVFNGDHSALKKLPQGISLTADYLNNRKTILAAPKSRSPISYLRLRQACAHNIRNADFDIPLGCFTCVTGVSGSGKSTLLHTLLHKSLMRLRGALPDGEDHGKIATIEGAERIGQILLVDQAPLSKTPRSTPALYTGVFDGIRRLFAELDDAKAAGFCVGDFSFNSGCGRCERCGGAGFEKVEMQFLSDIFVRCPECEGRRFKPELLKIQLDRHSIHDVLEMTVSEAVTFFRRRGLEREIVDPLRLLEETGLGYLRLGQPLNTLSGGESQRLKLVGHLAARRSGINRFPKKTDLLLFDEPTTGLHFDDIALLLNVFHRLADEGETLVVIEHNLHVIKNADHIIDLGPGPGAAGGTIVAAGKPFEIASNSRSVTGRYLAPLLGLKPRTHRKTLAKTKSVPNDIPLIPGKIAIRGAREHNLKNISVDIPRDQLVVITGLSGSGKSSLAFDLLFAEGQRRFLDSMSAYARQFVGQMEKPDVDWVGGLPPTVAIEQRITRGGGKSTVATVTEIYHFLRLLFAKLGSQFCPDCDLAVVQRSRASIQRLLIDAAQTGPVRVLAPLVKGRKGFHSEIAEWALSHGYTDLLVDGQIMKAKGFQKLDRFKEHSIDAVIFTLPREARSLEGEMESRLDTALKIGKGVIKFLDRRNRIRILSIEMACPGCGRSFEPLDPRLFSFNSPHGWCPACRGYGVIWNGNRGAILERRDESESVLEFELREERCFESAEVVELSDCHACRGARLNSVARAVRFQGMAIHEFTRLSADRATTALAQFKLNGTDYEIARDIIREISSRLDFMRQAGLGYLALDRSAKTLSGGESQRIRLAAQIGSTLRSTLYVLDEPTIGLHPRDNIRLLEMLETLRARGNSLVVVEHDEETIRRADHILDLGPAAGREGGRVVAEGTPAQLLNNPASPTGRALSQPMAHPLLGHRRKPGRAGWIKLRGARANNLQSIDVRIPKKCLTVITGVSGSGKSSLMRGVLRPAVEEGLALSRTQGKRKKGKDAARPWLSISGLDGLDGVVEVDQSPIGKTPRSTPATYVGFFDQIRQLFAQLPAARMRGLTASDFSFNTGRGRCEACGGHGTIKIEMNFLPPSHVPCEECGGSRFNPRLLEITLDGKSISQVMAMAVDEAATFFKAFPKIAHPLSLLAETGLGYLQLGQPSPTLSGGEAQRIKLVTELARRGPTLTRLNNASVRALQPSGRLLLLEEPTIGLHMADVEKLVRLLHRLVDGGDTIVIIEHNTSLMAEADYLLDIGPEPGENGGRLVASGSPEEVVLCPESRTAPFLAQLLGRTYAHPASEC